MEIPDSDLDSWINSGEKNDTTDCENAHVFPRGFHSKTMDCLTKMMWMLFQHNLKNAANINRNMVLSHNSRAWDVGCTMKRTSKSPWVSTLWSSMTTGWGLGVPPWLRKPKKKCSNLHFDYWLFLTCDVESTNKCIRQLKVSVLSQVWDLKCHFPSMIVAYLKP